MRRIDQLLAEYEDSHQDRTNKLIHWICVPLTFLSIVGLLWSAPFLIETFPWVNWATVAMVPVALYYLRLSPPLAVGMLIQMVLFCWCAHLVDTRLGLPLWLVSIVIFVAASVSLNIGHKVEAKKPSFFKDLQFLLIGPAWLMQFIYKRLGIPY